MNGQKVLITGGTGSFGKKFVEMILEQYPDIERLVIYSRDENKQYEMALDYPQIKYPQIRFFIGDVRDAVRLKRACEGIDIIIHAAAMKHVPIAEYNPFECISTNVIGAQNVINAAIDCGVKKVVALSTDKACSPINLYGATKLCSDKLFIAANEIKGSRDVKFSVVRYGNVMGSRGSVIPFFLKQKDKYPITHKDMTRFNITLDQGVKMVFNAIEKAWGGEIFVPKIPSYRILDVVKAINPDAEIDIIGIRPGEKLHEEMISESDTLNTWDCGKYFVILPHVPSESWVEANSATHVPHNHSYNSGQNEFLSVETLKEMIGQL